MPGDGGKKSALRIFFATDVHGSERAFRKFLAAAKAYEAGALILGGDIAGKGLGPIRSVDGTLSAKVRGESVVVPKDGEPRLRAEINRLGFYSVIVDDDEFERLEADPKQLDAAFRREIKAQVEAWCRLRDQRLGPSVRCPITPRAGAPAARR